MSEAEAGKVLELGVPAWLRWPLELQLPPLGFVRPLVAEELQLPDLGQHRPRRVDAHLLRHEPDVEQPALGLWVARGGVVPVAGVLFRAVVSVRARLRLHRVHARSKYLLQRAAGVVE